MELSRRGFLKFTSATGTAGLAMASKNVRASTHLKPVNPEWLGVLVDTTVCTGCRRCEWACKDNNKLPTSAMGTYEEKSVFEKMRRPDAGALTVVNQFENPENSEKPYYLKVQCMHCNDAACVSACIVGALSKDEGTGTVRYDAQKCIGCRYCMAACPFDIPAYEYNNALTPQVRKCTFCFQNLNKYEGKPACIKICPVECLLFGKRSELIEAAHKKIERYPDRYVDHVYGEHELGGTSWMYLTGKPISEMAMQNFDSRPIPSYTEPVQHGLFKKFIPPISLFAFLGGIMWLFKDQEKNAAKTEGGK